MMKLNKNIDKSLLINNDKLMNDFINYFCNNFDINKNEIDYISEFIINKSIKHLMTNHYKLDKQLFIDIVYSAYHKNYLCLKRFKTPLYHVFSFDELKTIINKKKNNIYILFDNYDLHSIKYYLALWEELHS